MGVEVKIDSKGRIVVPPEIRRDLSLNSGDTVLIAKTEEGIVLAPGKKLDFMGNFKEIIASSPKRTGKPENWPPSRMKRIWAEAR